LNDVDCGPSAAHCGPNDECQDGNEGDPCVDANDCSTTAPFCAPDMKCHNGSKGDPCSGDAQCDGSLECDGGSCDD